MYREKGKGKSGEEVAQKKVLCANAQGTFLTGTGLFIAK